MPKALYTATVLRHILAFHLPYIEELRNGGWEVHAAGKEEQPGQMENCLQYLDKVWDVPFERLPFALGNIKAYRQLKQLLEEERYDLVVCNTPVGGVLTRLAAANVRKNGTKVVYIGHGFHFYKGAPLKNWLLYYPVEKLLARKCDTVVTIVEEDYQRAKRHFASPIARIHGIGVDPGRFHPVSDEKKAELREKEHLPDDAFVVLCTGELNRNKDQQTLIRAAALCREEISCLKVLLAGSGEEEAALRTLVQELKLEDTVTFLGYRKDMENLVPAADVVVSCSHREGLGINILEGMLCNKAVIASENRGHRELIEPGVNGYRFPVCESKMLSEHLVRLYQRPDERIRMGEAGALRAQSYTVDYVKKELMPVLSVQAEAVGK